MKSAKVTDAKAGAQHYRRVMAAFDGALSLGRGERAAFLDRQCGGDAALRREVEAMLSQADSTHAPVEAGGGIQAVFRAGEAAAETTGLSATAPHLLAGQYRILRIIGEGGMGIVYEAEQALPRRIVALKAIRSAFASRQMLERFVQEAHILGRLHHPGIAQIYEAGAAVAERSDQAFFAMEFVDGPSLTEYAKRHGLPLGERVELLARVCDAVQHAHQRGVIHRDLKPSNILVDPSGQPKILDFGVARLAERDTDGLVSNTHAGQLVGTLPYMSPEQVGGDSNEVDTRSDVYALGVLLYELATGELPHPVGERTLPQMLLVIQREEAPRLSKKNRALAGDIESIAAMALAKEKSRRYASAAELGLDLRRFLEGDAVLAKRDSALYVLRKQIERHRTLTAAVAAAVIGLIAFAVYNEVRADREMRAKQTALSALDEADVQRRRADESAGQLAAALRSSNIERGRLMSASGDLRGAERVLWNEHLEHPTPSSHWALWDLYAHYPCTRAFGGDDTVLSLALSPDARSFATGSQDKLVRVWDLESGTPSTVFAGHGAAVIAVAYAPAARRLYSASMDGTIKAWDLDRRAEAWSLHVDGELSSMACARDGRRAAACCRDGRMRVVDLEHGRLTLEHRGPSGAMSAVCFGPDADTFVTGGGDAVLRVWNASTGELVRELGGEVESITGLCVSPDGHHLASGSRDGAVELRAWPTLEVEGRLKSDDGTLSSLAFDSAGRRLLATGSRRVEVWDVDRRARATDDAELDQPSFAAQFLADGRTIIAGSVGGPMRVWELDIRSIPSAIGPPFARDQVVALSHDGRWAAGGGKDNSISLLDMATETNVGVFRGHDAPLRTISFDAQGERLVSAGYDNTVKVWNVADRSCSFTLEKQAAFVNGVRFSPDGRTIGVGLMNGAVRLYDAATGMLAHTLDTSLGEAQRFAFSPDSARLATTYRGREIQVWDARSGEPRERLQAPDAAWSIAFVPRSDLLVVGAWNGALEVWDVGAKKLVRTMAGHGQVVNSLSIAGSAAIASAGADGCLRLWDADAGECLATFDARVGPAENVLLSDDGRALTGVFADGSLRRWDLAGFDRRIAGNADYQAARRAAEAASAEAARRGAAGR